MLWTKTYCLVSALAVIGTIGVAGQKALVDPPSRIHGLERGDRKSNTDVVKELSWERETLLGDLLKLLGSENRNAQYAAASLIGIYRLGNATPYLIKVIELHDPDLHPDRQAMPVWSEYPAVEALIRIGKPAEPELLRAIATSPRKEVRDHCAHAIHRIEGTELAIVILQRAAKSEQSPEGVGRLNEAIESIQAADR